MDYQRFIQQLPGLYESWGQESVRPKSEQFQAVLDIVLGMTAVNAMQLLNFAVECMEPDEIYCQVGCFHGATLIGALLDHPEQMAYAVDNFSEFDNPEENFEQLITNLSLFDLDKQVIFCYQDFEEFFFELREIDRETKIGVYFYDGVSDYRSQLLGLLLIRPFLAEKALIIVNDSNSSSVQQANWDFMAAHPQCQLLLDLSCPKDGHCTFENSIHVLGWDVHQKSGYEWSFVENFRNKPLIKAIYDLHIDLEFRRKQKILNYLYEEASCLYNAGQYLEAEQKYKEILQCDRNQSNAWYSLGIVYYSMARYQDAINMLLKSMEKQTGDMNFYIALAECYKILNQQEEAIKAYQEGIKHYPNAANIYCRLVIVLESFGRIQEAIAVADEASHLLPDDLTLKLEKQRLLPVIYDNSQEIDFYRCRFAQYLDDLTQQTFLEPAEARKNALIGIGRRTNFYLQYQGKNDLELQSRYGQFVHRVMAANYPQWAKPLTISPVRAGEKIRVAYVSAFLSNHAGAKWALGWIKNHNRQNFEIYCYYTGRNPDSITQQFQIYSDVFHHIPDDLESVCQQIAADKLHIIVYADIGMDPQTTQMAGLRLAPVQCTAWGHPVTSGLPTIDYYLSSELMEPENAEEHYSEKLIRLPNLGICYAKPVILEIRKNRSEFQLRDEAVVYLSCQSLCKYLPEHDYIFPTIAQRIPQAQFVFIDTKTSGSITDKFWQRLKKAFASFDLNSEEYCLMLPRLNHIDYLNLNLVTDIFLDTFSWSGGNTTLEAIACNLPVVTCPGEFMRGRHSYGILKMLGVTETIAKDEAEYIEIAVRLSLDTDWRDSIVQRIKDSHSRLYDDKTCVAALEAFYQRVVREGQSEQEYRE